MSRNTTKAVRIERLGPPHVLMVRDVPLPEVGADDVHIEVHAAGLNFADLLMRAGLYGTVPPRPYSPGFEVAGEVVRTGPGVHGLETGRRVVALLRHGGYARDVVVPAAQVFEYPATLTAVQAAAIPVAFLTAWVCLFEAGRARAEETVLILSAAGGVGTAAVQLAVRHGMRVIGTAGSARKRRFVVDELRAARCFDSRRDWESEVRELVGDRGVDLALDAVGGAATKACRRLLGPLGRLGFYGLSDAIPGERKHFLWVVRALLRTPWIHPLSLVEPNAGVFGVHLLHLGDRESILRPALEKIFASISAGELRAVVDRTFPLDRGGAVAAHRYVHGRKNLGKVVLVGPGVVSGP